MRSVTGACQASPPGDRLLDVREAAAMLGVSPKTIYQWAYERRIPVVKLFGKALRFRLTTIEKLIADSERPALRSLAQRP
jgi:excisionase family DNA binding protein